MPFVLALRRDFQTLSKERNVIAAISLLSHNGSTSALLPSYLKENSWTQFFWFVTENISPEEEYKIACLLMVFVAVSMPTLASNVMSQYSPAIEGTNFCISDSRWTAANEIRLYLCCLNCGPLERRVLMCMTFIACVLTLYKSFKVTATTFTVWLKR